VLDARAPFGEPLGRGTTFFLTTTNMQLTLTLSSREDMQAAFDLLGAALGVGTVEQPPEDAPSGTPALPSSTVAPLAPEVRARLDTMASTPTAQEKRKPGRPKKVTVEAAKPAVPVDEAALIAARSELKTYFVPIATRFGEEPFRKVFKDVGAQAIRELTTLEAIAQVRAGIEAKAMELEEANETGTGA